MAFRAPSRSHLPRSPEIGVFHAPVAAQRKGLDRQTLGPSRRECIRRRLDMKISTARRLIQPKAVLEAVLAVPSLLWIPSSPAARRALMVVLLLIAGSFPSAVAYSPVTIAPWRGRSEYVRQYLCSSDCLDQSFLCCNSEGGCRACFDFDVTYGRKEIILYGDPDVCESPPDSTGSFGVCPIRMNICLAFECLIEWR